MSDDFVTQLVLEQLTQRAQEAEAEAGRCRAMYYLLCNLLDRQGCTCGERGMCAYCEWRDRR